MKDTSAVAMFKVIRDEKSNFLFNEINTQLYLLAWTTTPWTLPSNTALAVGSKIRYCRVLTSDQYTKREITVVLAEDLFRTYFTSDPSLSFSDQINVSLSAFKRQAWDKEVESSSIAEKETPSFFKVTKRQHSKKLSDYSFNGSQLDGIH